MLLNKAALRNYILHRVKIVRPGHEFTQVKASFYNDLELQLKKSIDTLLQQQPSVGKTIQ